MLPASNRLLGQRAPLILTTLTLLGRGYCHLCDDMLAALEPWRASHGFEVKLVDVDEHPELELLHGERVPVLFLGEQEICHYFLDVAALTRTLNPALGAGPAALRS